MKQTIAIVRLLVKKFDYRSVDLFTQKIAEIRRQLPMEIEVE